MSEYYNQTISIPKIYQSLYVCHARLAKEHTQRHCDFTFNRNRSEINKVSVPERPQLPLCIYLLFSPSKLWHCQVECCHHTLTRQTVHSEFITHNKVSNYTLSPRYKSRSSFFIFYCWDCLFSDCYWMPTDYVFIMVCSTLPFWLKEVTAGWNNYGARREDVLLCLYTNTWYLEYFQVMWYDIYSITHPHCTLLLQLKVCKNKYTIWQPHNGLWSSRYSRYLYVCIKGGRA